MNRKSDVIVVASELDLANQRYYVQVWKALVELSRDMKVSRRSLIDGISLMSTGEKLIVLPTGDRFVMPDLSKVWPVWSDRWFSYYLEAEASGKLPKRYCRRRMQRLMLVDLYLRYYHPDRARAIILNMNSQFSDLMAA